MTETPIKTRADGSIAIEHYLARGRQMRSEEAHRLVKAARPQISAPEPGFWAWLSRFGRAPA